MKSTKIVLVTDIIDFFNRRMHNKGMGKGI
jgi:hypothetical protein